MNLLGIDFEDWYHPQLVEPFVPENKKIPDNALVVGSPGKVIRQLTEDEVEAVKKNAIRYQNNWKKYSKSIF